MMPFFRRPHLFVGHLERYIFALHYLRGRKVLDAGAKDGYGAMILSYFAKHITLADRNKDYLELARKTYKFLCSTDFIEVDFESNFPKGEWNVVVAFEVIEHVANTEFFVKNIADHLINGGVLIFSVPHMIENPDHKVLFDEKKIKDLISKYFKIVEFYVQDKVGISNSPAVSPPKSYIGIAKKL